MSHDSTCACGVVYFQSAMLLALLHLNNVKEVSIFKFAMRLTLFGVSSHQNCWHLVQDVSTSTVCFRPFSISSQIRLFCLICKAISKTLIIYEPLLAVVDLVSFQ